MSDDKDMKLGKFMDNLGVLFMLVCVVLVFAYLILLLAVNTILQPVGSGC